VINKRPVTHTPNSALSPERPSKKARLKKIARSSIVPSSPQINWDNLINKDEEEEEEIPLVHHERHSKKQQDLRTSSSHTQKLTTVEEELDLSSWDADLDEIGNQLLDSLSI